MGLYLKQEESNTELSQKIKAELRRKAETSRDVDMYDEKKLSKTDVVETDDSAANNPVGRFIIIVSLAVLMIVIYFLAVK